MKYVSEIYIESVFGKLAKKVLSKGADVLNKSRSTLSKGGVNAATKPISKLGTVKSAKKLLNRSIKKVGKSPVGAAYSKGKQASKLMSRRVRRTVL